MLKRSKDFVNFLKEQYEEKAGYLMGAVGQYTKDISENSWLITQYSGEQKEKALYWLKNAKRVFDCNGLLDCFVGTDTRSQGSYTNRSTIKGTGKIPDQRKVPGAAVYMGAPSSIHHIGYLVEPVGNDWYVIEARGVMYGVVRTKLSERPWDGWSWLDKVLNYEQTDEEPTGDDVTVKSGTWYVREAPIDGTPLGIAKGGEKYRVEATWHKVVNGHGLEGWLSEKAIERK